MTDATIKLNDNKVTISTKENIEEIITDLNDLSCDTDMRIDMSWTGCKTGEDYHDDIKQALNLSLGEAPGRLEEIADDLYHQDDNAIMSHVEIDSSDLQHELEKIVARLESLNVEASPEGSVNAESIIKQFDTRIGEIRLKRRRSFTEDDYWEAIQQIVYVQQIKVWEEAKKIIESMTQKIQSTTE